MKHGMTAKIRSRLGPRGQSLVEFAITLPILLIILLGMSELGSALYSYQIVVNAAREGARYGAKTQYLPDENVAAWARQSAARLGITTQVDGAPAVDAEKATIIVTRLRKAYDDGEYAYEVINTHSEGGGQPSILTDEWFATQADKSEALTWPEGMPNQTMDLIAVEVMYDHPHLTGLFNIGRFIPDPIPMHSMTIMRIGGSRIPGCEAYPIAVDEETIRNAEVGDVLPDIWRGSGSGNFGWLRWPDATSAGSAGYLAGALGDPGLSRRDYDNPMDSSDHWLNTGDWVWANSGTINANEVRDALDALVGKKIRILVWDFADESGVNAMYHIVGFAWVEIIDYDLADEWIRARFMGWDETCTVLD